MQIPSSSGKIYQYVGVVARSRSRPDPFPTVAELYSILALATNFLYPLHPDVIRASSTVLLLLCGPSNQSKVRLFVVCSTWVCIVSATAPLSYIKSIMEGKKHIEGSLVISESPWYNLFELHTFEQLMMIAFEHTTLTEDRYVAPLSDWGSDFESEFEFDLEPVEPRPSKRAADDLIDGEGGTRKQRVT